MSARTDDRALPRDPTLVVRVRVGVEERAAYQLVSYDPERALFQRENLRANGLIAVTVRSDDRSAMSRHEAAAEK